MDRKHMEQLLAAVAKGELSTESALDKLVDFPVAEMGYANLDTQRMLRTGMPEVVYCRGKTPAQVVGITDRLTKHHDRVLLTRVSADQHQHLAGRYTDSHYDAAGQTFAICRVPAPQVAGRLLIVTAGTVDIPVAAEAQSSAQMMGLTVESIFDLGVAGLHRVWNVRDQLHAADVIIVIAGMDGVLPGVLAGLVAVPVIAVPTDTGYGANFNGVAPLLTMLNACASGIAVVNINNGFGAACMASSILKTAARVAAREGAK